MTFVVRGDEFTPELAVVQYDETHKSTSVIILTDEEAVELAEILNAAVTERQLASASGRRKGGDRDVSRNIARRRAKSHARRMVQGDYQIKARDLQRVREGEEGKERGPTSPKGRDGEGGSEDRDFGIPRWF